MINGNTTIIDALLGSSGKDELDKYKNVDIDSDLRIKVFKFLYEHRGEYYSFNDIIKNVIGFKPLKKHIHIMNSLSFYKLVDYDFNIQKYRYKDSDESRRLLNRLSF